MVRSRGNPQFLFSTSHSRVVDCLFWDTVITVPKKIITISKHMVEMAHLNVVSVVAKEVVRESRGENGIANVHWDDVGRGVLH